ncbi:MAG: hypothetical protein LBH31_03755 [Burkholderiaceae bacterium]|nr:hypothetical protein [Burkholderiaceae bacterium]
MTGCGGGSDNGSSDNGNNNGNNNSGGGAPPTVAGAAQGVWQGTDTNGYQLTLVILDSGATYGTFASGGATSMVFGNTAVSGNTLSGSMTKYTFWDAARATMAYSGSVTPQNTLSIVMNNNGNDVFTGHYLNGYGQPASPAGTYTGAAVIGATFLSPSNNPNAVVTITNTGSVSISLAGYVTCPAYGMVAPHHNTGIFDFSAIFTGSGCPAQMLGGPITGVAYLTANNGIQINATASGGGIFWLPGSKQQ